MQIASRFEGRRMLPEPLLDLLRAWWLAARERCMMLPGGWLFPGQNPVSPLTARQLRRATSFFWMAAVLGSWFRRSPVRRRSLANPPEGIGNLVRNVRHDRLPPMNAEGTNGTDFARLCVQVLAVFGRRACHFPTVWYCQRNYRPHWIACPAGQD